MPTHVKHGGVWYPVKTLYTKQEGVWVPVQRAFLKQGGIWTPVFEAAVEVILGSAVDVGIQTLFSAEDWTNPYKKKRVVIPSGAIIGASSISAAALRTGSGWEGELEIIVDGEVQGAGGAANGGAGGPAISVQQEGAIIIINGAVSGGGGGGGKGGTGGKGGNGGSTAREPTSGENFSGSNPVYAWTYRADNQNIQIRWNVASTSTITHTVAADSNNHSRTYYAASDGWTYYRGTQQSSYQGVTSYAIWRSKVTTTTGGNGGAGGDGGVGQGYNQAKTSGAAGAAGSAGGSGAGKGGTGGQGGAGGDWGSAGTAGDTGATGASGNSTAGSAGTPGSAGGAAGAAIIGSPAIIINNGTINGSY